MNRLARLWGASIWHRGAIPASEAKYATPLKRVMLPLFDITVVALGIYGLGTGGFVALRLALPYPLPCVIYGLISLTGVVCFFGIAFPRLWAVEMAGKTAMLGTLLVLLGAFLYAGSTIPGHAGMVAAPMVLWGIFILGFRLWNLGEELGKRIRARKGGGVEWSG